MSATIADSVDLIQSVNEDADEARFILTSRTEIVYVLRNLIRARALTLVCFGAGQDTLLAPLLAVDSEADGLYFDCSGSPAINAAVLKATRLLFVSAQDKVKIRFATAPARRVTLDGRDAFRVSLPAEMLRLQRRELYRILAPVARPVKCIFSVDHQDGYRYVETRLHDVSQGGVAVIVQPGELPVEMGTSYSNCRIALPDVGNVVVSMEIRHTQPLTLLNGKSVLRVGCRFVRPSSAALALVQRYMMKAERERAVRD